jgi:hypothetical protein
MWLAGLSWPLKKLVPLWHWLQSPLAGCEASATLKVPAAARGRVWKPVYCAPLVSTVGAIGYALMPIQTELASWHEEQPLVMPEWICAVVGAGVANSVPGAVLVALAWIRPDTLASVPAWQLSQVVLDGMCEPAPIGDVGGMPTMAVMPEKLAAVPAGTWQAAQLLLMPAWLMREPENLAPLPTGVLVMLEPVPTWQLSHAAVVGM